MKILLGSAISTHFQQLFLAAENVDLITAYLTSGLFNLLAEEEIFNRRVNLFIRGNRKDFQTKACDILVLEKLHQLGVNCFLVKDLHSKVYIFDQEVALVGSANLTNKGLGLALNGNNIECLCEYDISDKSYLEFLSMIKGAIVVDEELLNFMHLSLDNNNDSSSTAYDEWEFLLNMDIVEKLTINDLPLYNLNSNTNDFESFEHDKIVLGLDQDLNKFRDKFKQSNLYFYLLKLLQSREKKQIFFGEFCTLVHSDLLSEQDLSRREVKQYIINIFSYLKELDLDNIKVDRPNHSQRIYLLDLY